MNVEAVPNDQQQRQEDPQQDAEAAPRGLRGKFDAFARFATSRAALAKYESRVALSGVFKALVLGALALGMMLTAFALAVVLALVLLMENADMDPASAVGALALGSLVLGAIFGFAAWRSVARPFYKHLTEQLKKDREWLGHTGTDRN